MKKENGNNKKSQETSGHSYKKTSIVIAILVGALACYYSYSIRLKNSNYEDDEELQENLKKYKIFTPQVRMQLRYIGYFLITSQISLHIGIGRVQWRRRK